MKTASAIVKFFAVVDVEFPDEIDEDSQEFIEFVWTQVIPSGVFAADWGVELIPTQVMKYEA